jgi:hypothetical protein
VRAHPNLAHESNTRAASTDILLTCYLLSEPGDLLAKTFRAILRRIVPLEHEHLDAVNEEGN